MAVMLLQGLQCNDGCNALAGVTISLTYASTAQESAFKRSAGSKACLVRFNQLSLKLFLCELLLVG
jgi:hypothetical protein